MGILLDKPKGIFCFRTGNIAQWLEQYSYTVPVKGSSPFISTLSTLITSHPKDNTTNYNR